MKNDTLSNSANASDNLLRLCSLIPLLGRSSEMINSIRKAFGNLRTHTREDFPDPVGSRPCRNSSDIPFRYFPSAWKKKLCE